MQPRSFHHVHVGQVSWFRVHRRPADSMGQSSRFEQPQQHVPVARPKMKSGFRYMRGVGRDGVAMPQTSARTSVRRLLTVRLAFFPW